MDTRKPTSNGQLVGLPPRIESTKFCMWASGDAVVAALHFAPLRTIDLLWRVADLRVFRDGAVGAEDVLADAQRAVAEPGIPTEEQFFGMLHGHVHRVRNLAAVFPQVDAARHGDFRGNLQIERLSSYLLDTTLALGHRGQCMRPCGWHEQVEEPASASGFRAHG